MARGKVVVHDAGQVVIDGAGQVVLHDAGRVVVAGAKQVVVHDAGQVVVDYAEQVVVLVDDAKPPIVSEFSWTVPITFHFRQNIPF